MTRKDLEIRTNYVSLNTLLSREKLVFETETVLSVAAASRLIESILIDIPIGPIWIDRTGDQAIVIDGARRLRILTSFLNDEFALSGLECLTSCAGRKKSLLDPHFLRKLEELEVLVHSIEKGTSTEAKELIVKRIKGDL